MSHKKPFLPSKQCPCCGLAFTWRKKWRNNWENVIYCSERCRRTKTSSKNTVTTVHSAK